MIKIILIILIIFITYKIYRGKVYENMVGSLVYPNYVPNTDMKFTNNIVPFDIDYMCQDKSTKKYLEWPCWWRENESNFLIESQKLPKKFNNYLKNTPLKYDGVWERKCNTNYLKCIW